MTDSHALSILVPDFVLPAEGTPPAPLRDPAGTPPAQPVALLEALTWTLFARAAATTPADAKQAWRHAYLQLDGDTPGRVWLDLTPGFFELDFSAPVVASEPSGDGAGPARQTQVAAVRRATRPFTGRAVPLFAPGAAAPTTEAVAGDFPSPVAIWLATSEQLNEISRAGVASQEFALWTEDDDAEVSGRGVREVALAAALLLLGFHEPMSAATTSSRAALIEHATTNGGEQTAAGSLHTLPVTSQGLHQAPPRVDNALLADQAALSDPTRTRIIVDIAGQRAYLLVDGRIAVDTPVSTGRSGHDTPRGTYTITEKVRDGKVSTLYHSAMPFWMRLGDSAVGLHVEKLPGEAASHGCVRLPRESAKVLFEHTPSGTTVEIVDRWNQTDVAQR